MLKRIKTITTITMLMLLGLTCAAALHPQTAFAKADETNVSTSCNMTNVKKGDTVKIKVSTKKMSVSTFIASVEFDGDILEYKGYRGPDKGKNVYLTKQGDSDVHTEVTVEKNKDDSIIGMYAVGVKETEFAAADPLATLIFEAKADGKVDYVTTETSDGKDGFTSEEILNAGRTDNQIAGETGSKTGEDAAMQRGQSSDQSGGSIPGIAIAVMVIAALAIIAAIIIRKKRRS